jgi:tetratricopeptide (TPR) repeat protein
MARALDRHLQGDWEGAIADYTRAIGHYEHAGDRALAYLGRGHVRKSAGDMPGAVADYDCAIELQPGHAGAYLSRGIAHRDCGNRQEAISDLRMVRELSADPRWRRQADEQLRALEAEVPKPPT